MKLKINRKLSLNKKTISNMQSEEMNEAKGGTLTLIGDGQSVCICTVTWYYTCDQNTCFPERCYVKKEDTVHVAQNNQL